VQLILTFKFDKKFNTHEFKLSGKDAIATALSFYNLKNGR
jgi:hypothetical protein